MNKAQYEYLHRLIEAMAMKQFLPPDLGPAGRQDFEEGLSKSAWSLMEQFQYDWKKYQAEETSKEERQKIEKNLENLAKALPSVTKSTLSAITAFKNGDAISGSAAIMEICASLTPLLAGLSAAGGPPGMLVGAIFSIVGQILIFFAPQAESLTKQIEKLLRDLKAEETQKDITTVHQSIRVYARSLRLAAHAASKAMGKDKSASDWISITDEIVKLMNPLEGNTITLFWGVMNWLNQPKNQTLDLWPTILSAACQAWADMMAAALTLLSLVHTDQVQERFETAEELPDPTGAVEKALKQLQRSVIVRLVVTKANNDILLEILEQLTPAAQNRGMFWYNGFGKGPLYAGTNIQQGRFENLAYESKRMAVAVSRANIGEPDPLYHVFLLEQGGPGYDRTYYKDVTPPYKYSGVFQELKCDKYSLQGLTDIWATPATAHNDKTDVLFYSAKDNNIRGFVLSKDRKVHEGGYARDVESRLNVMSVRAVHNPESFVDDPDETAEFPSVLKGIDLLVYGGIEYSSDIYADPRGGGGGYVRSPWDSYSGLGVDRHYLWVFGSVGFACATHASVMRCLKKQIQQPRWMIHYPDKLLYAASYAPNKDKVKDGSPLLGLADLCPCEDGTLVAAIYTRSVEEDAIYTGALPAYRYVFKDANAVYNAVYHTDLEKGAIAVEWTKIGGENLAVRVQKMPIFCWSLIESLPVLLDRLAPQLDSLARFS